EGSVTGTPLVYRSSSLQPEEKGLSVKGTHPWSERYPLRAAPLSQRKIVLTPLDAEGQVVYNSTFPHTTNDGALWAGRGISATVSAGGQVRWGPVTARLYPSLVYAENRAFPLAPLTFAPGDRSPYSFSWQRGSIDLPQRFGDASVKYLDWGQTGVRMD